MRTLKDGQLISEGLKMISEGLKSLVDVVIRDLGYSGARVETKGSLNYPKFLHFSLSNAFNGKHLA